MATYLLVEDEDENLAKTLEEFGLSVDWTDDGTKAIELLRGKEYEGVILDLALRSGLQGLQILEWLSTNRMNISVIVVTAHGHLGIRALELGVDALLQKPVEARHIVSYLNRAIELRKLRSENQILLQRIEAIGFGTPLQIIERTCARFHRVAKQLRQRRANRPVFAIIDEYDVQDLLHAMLRLFFDDIRPEEWSPSHGGGPSRLDFLLKKERIVIETKMTRAGLMTKELGNQLIVDIERYKSHPDCETLVCFVYDPEELISNPPEIENDLSRVEGPLPVRVYIAPKNQ